MNGRIPAACLLLAGLASAQVTTSVLPNPSLNFTGDTVTLQVRVHAPGGTANIDWLCAFLKPSAESTHRYAVAVNPQTRYLGLSRTVPEQYSSPQLFLNTGTVDLSSNPYTLGDLQLRGYRLNITATQIEFDITLRRLNAYTGTEVITLGALDNGNLGSPGFWTEAATWNYAPSAATPTATPSSFTLPAAWWNGEIALTGFATTPAVTSNQPWLTLQETSATRVRFRVERNEGAAARPALLTIGPLSVPIHQSGWTSTGATTALTGPTAFTGDTANLSLQVTSPNGRNAIQWLNLFLKPGPEELHWFSVTLNAAELTLGLADQRGPERYTNPWQPAVEGSTVSVPDFGLAPDLWITAYRLYPADPANPNLLHLELTLRRAYPGNQVLTLRALDSAGTPSSPSHWVTAGTWNYSGATPPADFTLTPASPVSASTLSGQPGFIDLTLTPTSGSPGTITLSTTETNVTFTNNPADLNTGPKTVRVNLPARSASYSFNVTAGPKTHTINVTVTPPSISLSANPPTAVYAGQTATIPLALTATGWTGPVALTCLSAAPGLYCPTGQQTTTATANPTLQVVTDAATPTGAAVTVIATPTGPGAPAAKSAVTTVTLTRGFTLANPTPAALTLYQKVPATLELMLLPSGGFTGTVNFTCTGIPGLACTGSTTVAGNTPLTVRLALQAANSSGFTPVTISASGGGAANSAGVNIEVKPTSVSSIIEPTSGNTLPQSTLTPSQTLPGFFDRSPNRITFRWGPGTNVTSYRLRVFSGIDAVVYDGTTTNTFSEPIAVAPFCANPPACPTYGLGVTWTAQVTYFNGLTPIGTATATYPIGGDLYPPRNFAPANGANLSSTTTFTWDHPTNGAAGYRISVGTLGPRSWNIFQSFYTATPIPPQSVTVTGIPAAPIPVYVTLETQYNNVSGLHSAQSYVFNTTPIGGTTGGSSGVPGTVTLTIALPQGMSVPAVPGKSVIATTVDVSGTYQGPIKLECTGPSGITCEPMSVGLVGIGSSQSVPLIVKTPPGATPGTGTLVVIAKAAPDGATKATTSASARVGGLDPTFFGFETSDTYNDGQRRWHYWYSSSDCSDGTSSLIPTPIPVPPTGPYGCEVEKIDVKNCRVPEFYTEVRLERWSQTALALSFVSSPDATPGSYSLQCDMVVRDGLNTREVSAFTSPQLLRILPAPRLTGISPASGEQGTSVRVELLGQFDTSNPLTVKVDGSTGIDVLPGDVADTSTKLVRFFSIAANAPESRRNVSVELTSPSPSLLGFAAQRTVRSPTVAFQVQGAPQLRIGGDQLPLDGESANFTVLVDSSTTSPTNYNWTFSAPSGAGNGPSVLFSSPVAQAAPPGQRITVANARWFAFPDKECPQNQAEADSMRLASYSILATVAFANGRTAPATINMIVRLPNPAGQVGVPAISGLGIQSQGLSWVPAPKSSLSRSLPRMQVFVPAASQFYNKVTAHERVHENQWLPGGTAAHLYSLDDFYNRIKDLITLVSDDPNGSMLRGLIEAEYARFIVDESVRYRAIYSQLELEAYAVSDLIPPLYFYQRCGRTTFTP